MGGEAGEQRVVLGEGMSRREGCRVLKVLELSGPYVMKKGYTGRQFLRQSAGGNLLVEVSYTTGSKPGLQCSSFLPSPWCKLARLSSGKTFLSQHSFSLLCYSCVIPLPFRSRLVKYKLSV